MRSEKEIRDVIVKLEEKDKDKYVLVTDYLEWVLEGDGDLEEHCAACRWWVGKHTLTGLGSSWPCESCRCDKWEAKEGVCWTKP